MDQHVIAIIPARSGSKRLRDKNLSLFYENSFIQSVYNAASDSNVNSIVVSTDSRSYLDSIYKCFSLYDKYLSIMEKYCE